MSHQIRRLLTAFGLTAALLLAAPAPSRAANLWGLPAPSSLLARFGAWLEGLLPEAKPVSARPAVKTSTTTTSTTTTDPSTSTTDEGSLIDPNGVK